jgi:hypothetical protein
MDMELINRIGYDKFVSLLKKKAASIPGVLGKNPFPLKHDFAEGLYIREIFIPKGYFCIGAGHYDSYVNFVVSGDMSVITAEGVKRITGPQMIVSPAGTQRVGYSHEDTVWVTVHKNPDNERDVSVLENRLHYDTDGVDLLDAEIDMEELCHLS